MPATAHGLKPIARPTSSAAGSEFPRSASRTEQIKSAAAQASSRWADPEASIAHMPISSRPSHCASVSATVRRSHRPVEGSANAVPNTAAQDSHSSCSPRPKGGRCQVSRGSAPIAATTQYGTRRRSAVSHTAGAPAARLERAAQRKAHPSAAHIATWTTSMPTVGASSWSTPKVTSAIGPACKAPSRTYTCKCAEPNRRCPPPASRPQSVSAQTGTEAIATSRASPTSRPGLVSVSTW